MADLKTANIIETEASTYSAKINIAGHKIEVDEPKSFEGGGDTGPSPFDLLVSSLAACTIMTMRWYAEQKSLPLVEAEAIVTYDQKMNHFTKAITLNGDQLTQEDKDKLIEMAAKCPVQRAMTGDITVETLIKDF